MNLIDEKINELLLLAEQEKDINLLILLNGFRGARLAGLDGVFTKEIQIIIREKIIPVLNSIKYSMN